MYDRTKEGNKRYKIKTNALTKKRAVDIICDNKTNEAMFASRTKKGLSHNAAAFSIPRIKSFKQEAHISSRDRSRLGLSLTVLSLRFAYLRSLRTEASYVPFRKSASFPFVNF